MNLIVGIDEVGRGPLAGPITVGIFAAPKRMEKILLKNLFQNKLRDSKKLKEKEREVIAKEILKLKKEGKVFYEVCHVSNKVIDTKGLSFAIKSAISKLLKDYQHSVFIQLDGGLKAPVEFKKQQTIIKGDEKNVYIACASIVAKVSRDALMTRMAKRYPQYGLEVHKGYGTPSHRKALKIHGLSGLHRQSFCANLGAW